MKAPAILSAAAVLAISAGLLSAAPSMAATGVPAGCTADDFAAPSEVTSMTCLTLGEGAIFSAFTRLTSLEIGRPGAASPTLTRLPVLPGSLRNLGITANKITNFDALATLPALESLHIQGLHRGQSGTAGQ